MVYTGTMIEELIATVEREERRIAVLDVECDELAASSNAVAHITEPEVWHGAA
ncbi:MAG TPA: hypothetical protein VE998_02840 [Terriglobales bacterium]|nr:hypothetical protein [Terriglobales bacterium]